MKTIKPSLPNLSTRGTELPPPLCHAQDYERGLDLLKGSRSDGLELAESEFDCYGRNNGPRKQGFDALKQNYLLPEATTVTNAPWAIKTLSKAP